MKKFKLSTAEKNLLRFLIISVLVQIIIVLAFIDALAGLEPLDIQDTKQIDIIAEHIYLDSGGKAGSKLVVSCGSDEYIFWGNSTEDDPKVSQLENMIAVGDRLSLNYCEEWAIRGGKYNLIVHAQTETEVYRSINNVNANRKTGTTIFIIVLIIVELVFGLIVITRMTQDKNTIKLFIRKCKKHVRKKKTKSKGSV